MGEPLWKDPIVEEVRRAREAYAARFDFNLKAIYRDLKEREVRGEFDTVQRPPRPPASLPRTGS